MSNFTTDPERIVQAQVDAANGRDIKRFVSFYSFDALILDAQGREWLKGQDSITQVYGKLFEQSPKLHVDILKRIVSGAHVIEEEQLTGVNFEGLPESLHTAVVYRVNEGKIVHVQLL